MNKYLVILLLFFGELLCVSAQETIRLDECQQWARANFPLIKQFGLIEKSRDYSLQNANKSYLPQFSISGQATYQSDVTSLGIQIPGVTINTLSKDQYRVVGELSQVIYDGGLIKNQKESIKAEKESDKANLEVNLYKVKNQVNDLYFGILIFDKKLIQNKLYQKDVQLGLDYTKALVKNGVAFRSQADVVEAEFIKVNQQQTELQSLRNAYLLMLSQYVGKDLTTNVELQVPDEITTDSDINRPEIKYFESKVNYFNSQEKLLDSRNLPKLGFFVQGGYGRPGLNMLNNNFTGFYIGGLKLNWNLASFYTSKNERQLLQLSKNKIESEKETFLFTNRLESTQKNAEIEKFKTLLETDSELISLRARIKKATLAQLENGVITANDYLREINAEDQAIQNKILHEMQLLQSQYQYNNINGN